MKLFRFDARQTDDAPRHAFGSGELKYPNVEKHVEDLLPDNLHSAVPEEK